MKGKATSWVLLPVVLGIWATIGWKIYDGLNTPDEATNNSSVTEVKSKTQNEKDTILLLLNYRDPFLGEMPETKKKQSTNTASKTPVVIQPEIKEEKKNSVINYSGLVKRSSDGKTVGFMRIDGNSFFVEQGQIVAGVKVNKLWKDSAEVMVDGKKTIVKE